MPSKVFFYCLEFGMASELLSITLDWAEVLKEQGLEVTVFATHLKGKTEFEAYELGGGSFFNRLGAIAKMLLHLPRIIRERDCISVFYHMNHKALAVQGPILRLFGIHQTLWYSHAKKGRWLNYASIWADLILTTGSDAYPLKHKNIRFVGQAINCKKFQSRSKKNLSHASKYSIISVGRISKAKSLDKILCQDLSVEKRERIHITFVGPISDSNLMVELLNSSKKLGITVDFKPTIENTKLEVFLNSFNLYFSGTEKAIDKAAAEAAVCGLVIISDNYDLLEQIGLLKYYRRKGIIRPSIAAQIEHLVDQSDSTINQLQTEISIQAAIVFSLEGVVKNYLRDIELFKSQLF